MLHLPEATDRHLDGGDQLTALERLDQVGQRTGVASLFDQVPLAERGEDQHGRPPLAGDRPRRRQAVEAGHLDVEDGDVGLVLLDQLDGLVAPTGLAHDEIALFLEGLLQIEADDGLVLGDHDSGRHRLGSLLLAIGTGSVLRRPGGLVSRSRR